MAKYESGGPHTELMTDGLWVFSPKKKCFEGAATILDKRCPYGTDWRNGLPGYGKEEKENYISLKVDDSGIDADDTGEGEFFRAVCQLVPVDPDKESLLGIRQSFAPFIPKVLAQVHPGTRSGIDATGLTVVDDLLYDSLRRIASSVVCGPRSDWLEDSEIQTAVRLVLPGELAKYAVIEGTKAVTKAVAEGTRIVTKTKHLVFEFEGVGEMLDSLVAAAPDGNHAPADDAAKVYVAAVL